MASAVSKLKEAAVSFIESGKMCDKQPFNDRL